MMKIDCFRKFAAETESIMLPAAGCALVLAHALSSRLIERPRINSSSAGAPSLVRRRFRGS